MLEKVVSGGQTGVVERIRVLIVAGNRESTSPGIGARAEASLGRVFAASARAGPVLPG
jgi:hypothetical protein